MTAMVGIITMIIKSRPSRISANGETTRRFAASVKTTVSLPPSFDPNHLVKPLPISELVLIVYA
jgi:hypothetical protein